MTTAVHAEWLKLRTTPGTGWLLAALIAVTAALSAMADAAARCPAGGCQIDPVKTSLTGIYLGQAVVAVLAVTAISSEYGTGMIRVTFTAMPGRTVVLAAKAVVIAGFVLTVGAVAVLGSVLAGRIILPSHGFTAGRGYLLLSPAAGPALRASIGSVLYLALIALLSLGVAAAVRDTAAAIGSVLGLLYVAPIIAAVLGSSGASRQLQQIAPMTAGLAIQATTGLRSLPVSPWTGLGVLAAWAAAALLAGSLLLHLRDA
jgi:ABC-2 type transport system permease protein